MNGRVVDDVEEATSTKKLRTILDFILDHAGTDERPYLAVDIFGVKLLGLLDSGACRTILGGPGWMEIRKLGLHCMESQTKRCTVANGEDCMVDGEISLPFRLKDRIVVLQVLVVPSISQRLILGADFWIKMGIVPNLRHSEWSFCDSCEVLSIDTDHFLSVEQRTKLDLLLEELFSGKEEKLGCANSVEHIIRTTAEPIKQRHYPISPALLKFVNEELDKMLRDGIVERSSSPWASPIVMVPKKDKSYRFCVDYRKVNKVTERDAYPLPFVTSTLDKLRDARYLSSLDIKSAYWQVPVEEKSRPITAFVVPGRGLFQFRRMPFGLHNAPATWQRLIDRVLGIDLEPYVFVYLDDIIIIANDFQKHLEVLREVLQRLKGAGLTVSREKCQFCRSELKYLGYVVNQKGLAVDPEKVMSIIRIPTPTCVREVRTILGMASWYRRFIPDFSTIIAPMTSLLRKSQKFCWTNECTRALERIKTCLVSAPILTCPDFERSFDVQTDASNYGLGAVLTQNYPDGDRAIAYISRSLSKTERLYSTTEKECLAVVFAVEKFRPYIEGTRFRVITDHYSLKWLNNLKDPSGRLARWSVRLQQFDFEVVHRKGRDHLVPDALSRTVPDIAEVQVELEKNEVKTEINDSWYRRMCKNVNERPNLYPLWRLEGDKLYKFVGKRYFNLDDTGSEWKEVVPKDIRKTVIHDHHDIPTAGHGGVTKTTYRVAEKYYWPSMKQDIAKYIQHCKICIATKPEQKSRAGHLLGRPSVSKPWETICVDLVGPLPRTNRGYMYILSVVDYFSKFCLFFPLRTATSVNIVRIIEEHVYLLFGVPRVLVCDNGKQFISREFRNLANRYSVKLSYTALYHAQANAVERVHRVLKTMLSAYVEENHKNWDLYLPKVACAIRTARHEATGLTPYFINFGREMRLSGEAYDIPEGFENCVDRTEDLHGRSKEFVKLFKDVRERLDKAFAKNKAHYDLRRRPLQFNVGQKVWRRNYAISRAVNDFSAKLAPKYLGPFIVHKKVSPWTYVLIDKTGDLRGTWHAKDLKAHPPEQS